MRHFYIKEIKPFGIYPASNEEYIIDEDELEDRLDRIMSNPIACAGAVEILTAPAPPPKKDEYEVWVEEMPYMKSEWKAWFRRMPR